MSSQELADIQKNEMFRPPVDRTMRLLNPKFFEKTVTLAAAKVFEVNQITNCRKALGKDVLDLERVPSVQMVPSSEPGGTPTRGILLRPEIRPNGKRDVSGLRSQSRVSDSNERFVDMDFEHKRAREAAKDIYCAFHTYARLRSLDLLYVCGSWRAQSTLADFNVADIMHAILPDDVPDEIPQGFNTVGHIGTLDSRTFCIDLIETSSTSEFERRVPAVQAPYCSGHHRQEFADQNRHQQDRVRGIN